MNLLLRNLLFFLLTGIALQGLKASPAYLFPAQLPADTYEGAQLTPEGAWCWFADPRALHHSNTEGTINSTYIGYIDVHGNIKATQHDFLTGTTQEVLIRSYFQPDDHNNPTFLVLPDDRVMLFYSRHTDEACFYYRVSQQPGDITTLGPEVRLATSHNTTYPSPFILSDDPTGIYLCWRGINWHPTIARLSLPDEQDQVQFTWGPYQIVQSTGARPYAKYTSNGKDKLYLTYTTGHPDNENPNYVYFNTIDIATRQLQDIKGNTLSTIGGAIHRVSATAAYTAAYPDAVVENSYYRNWVWQTAIDAEGKPVVAMVRISADKSSHHYYYARWNGSSWQRSFVANGGGKFHQTSGLELCYSGGMALDDSDPSVLYCSQPVAGAYGTKYEIVKYEMGGDGQVLSSEPVTRNSRLNNSRPYVIQGSGSSPMKISWMNGNYYDWIVSSSRPLGFPTAIHVDYAFPEEEVELAAGLVINESFDAPVSEEMPDFVLSNGVLVSRPDQVNTFTLNTILSDFSISLSPCIYEGTYAGTLLQFGDVRVGLDASTLKTYVQQGDKHWNSTNVLGTSDVWQTQSRGTSGAWYTPTKLKYFNLSITYKGGWLTVYRNGLIDQRIAIAGVSLGEVSPGGFMGWIEDLKVYDRALNQEEVKALSAVSNSYTLNAALLSDIELSRLQLPDTVVTDVVLMSRTSAGTTISWSSSNPAVLATNGLVTFPATATTLKLTATIADQSREFDLVVLPRNIQQNRIADYTFAGDDEYNTGNQRMLRDRSGRGNDARIMGNAAVNGQLDLSANTSSGFSTNGYLIAPNGLLSTLRSASFLMKVKASTLTAQPRLFDFGSASSNSIFLRASTFSAGYKYNGASTTLINSSASLPVGEEVKVAMTYDARTRTTRVFLNGTQTAQSTAISYEPWQLTTIAADERNYIGRTQWWDTNVAGDNADFRGTIDDFRVYDIALTPEEIIQEQEQPTALDQPTANEIQFPNPVQAGESFRIRLQQNSTSPLNDTVELFSVNGKRIGRYVFSGAGITLPGIERRGVYVLRFLLAGEPVNYKLIVS